MAPKDSNIADSDSFKRSEFGVDHTPLASHEQSLQFLGVHSSSIEGKLVINLKI